MDQKEFTPIQEIGFNGLVEKIRTYSGAENKNVVKGIGDDATVLKTGADELVCSSSEIFLEGVHFDPSYTPFQHLGYKVVTAAVSDLYAMNAVPQQLLVNLAVPNKYSVEMVEELFKGIDIACKDYGVHLSGGDTTASHQVLSISVTAIGTAKDSDLIYRTGAKPGDIICLTGEVGAALAGLRILMREKKYWQESGDETFQPDLSEYQYVVERQLLPKARKDLPEGLSKAGVKPTSMIDVTQGVVNELRRIASGSGTGITLYSPAVPISLDTRKVADEMQEDVDKYAFYGGEDFEMLFTLQESDVEKLKAEFEDFAVIGKIEERDNQFVINTGEDRTIKIDLD